MYPLKPQHLLPAYTLRGWSILAPAPFNPDFALPCRIARIEKGCEALAPALAASPEFANMLATVCTAYAYGTSADLARAMGRAETLLTVLNHPSTSIDTNAPLAPDVDFRK